jgi:ribosomal protein L21
MYAVLKTGGKQHKVVVGETLSVELLDAAPGDTLWLPAILVSDGDKIVTGADAKNASVTVEVLGHGKADKVIAFQFRKRKGSKKMRGHRLPLTLVMVTVISVTGGMKPIKKAAIEAKTPETAVGAPAKKAAPKRATPKVAPKPKAAPASKAAPAPKAAVAPKAEKPVAAAKPAAKAAAPKAAAPKAAAPKAAAPKAAAKPGAAKAAAKPAAEKAAPAEKKPAAKKPTAPKAAAKPATEKKPAAPKKAAPKKTDKAE